MPTKRTRRRKRRRGNKDELTEASRNKLLEGHWYTLLDYTFDEGAMGPGGPKDEYFRELWEAYGEEMLAEYIEETPGERPWAWWQFDAPKDQRKIIEGELDSASDGLFFGCTNQYRPKSDYIVWEPEADFLERHGLLSPEEKAALKDNPPEPERSPTFAKHLLGGRTP